MKKYYTDETFNNLVATIVAPNDNPSFGGVWIGPMEEETLEGYRKILEKEKQRVKEMELAVSLCEMANRLGVKYYEAEEER